MAGPLVETSLADCPKHGFHTVGIIGRGPPIVTSDISGRKLSWPIKFTGVEDDVLKQEPESFHRLGDPADVVHHLRT